MFSLCFRVPCCAVERPIQCWTPTHNNQSNQPQHPQQTIHTENLLKEASTNINIEHSTMERSQQIVLDCLLSSEKGEILKRNGQELKKLKIGDLRHTTSYNIIQQRKGLGFKCVVPSPPSGMISWIEVLARSRREGGAESMCHGQDLGFIIVSWGWSSVHRDLPLYKMVSI